MGHRKALSFFAAMLAHSVTLLAGTFQTATLPQPGRLNAITGDVRVNGAPVSLISTGGMTLEAGRTIRTGHGMAEILLSPGSFLRLGNNSELTLDRVTPDIQVKLAGGEALIEAVDVEAPVVVKQKRSMEIIRKPGLYEFSRKRGVSRLAMSLLSWSRARSEQLSRESAASAQTNNGDTARWHGPAWYWDPWSASYTYLSALGVVTGPFGWPYYSPGYAPNYIPVHSGGDSWLYGPPVLSSPAPVQTPVPRPPGVPLAAPGVPQFPNNRF